MSKAFCIGNGESRKGFDLEQLRPHGKIYGCNALYRDFTPDVLVCVDQGISHEVYNSGYCDENETYFRNWTRVPGMLYETMINAGAGITAEEYKIVKEEKLINENERGDCQEFVMHGSNISGAVKIMKENKDIKIICADPLGSGMYSWIKTGKASPEGSSITEGIGQSRITANLREAKIDDSFQIEDNEALKIIFNLLKNEGLSLGPSSGINIAGAVKLAKLLGPGHTIATILCDYGTRYSSKIYNIDFLESKNLEIPDWLNRKD